MYPLWLNIVAGIVLCMIPIGMVFAVFVDDVIGIIILLFGFLGIWFFGNIAKRIKDRVRKVNNVVKST